MTYEQQRPHCMPCMLKPDHHIPLCISKPSRKLTRPLCMPSVRSFIVSMFHRLRPFERGSRLKLAQLHANRTAKLKDGLLRHVL